MIGQVHADVLRRHRAAVGLVDEVALDGHVLVTVLGAVEDDLAIEDVVEAGPALIAVGLAVAERVPGEAHVGRVHDRGVVDEAEILTGVAPDVEDAHRRERGALEPPRVAEADLDVEDAAGRDQIGVLGEVAHPRRRDAVLDLGAAVLVDPVLEVVAEGVHVTGEDQVRRHRRPIGVVRARACESVSPELIAHECSQPAGRGGGQQPGAVVRSIVGVPTWGAISQGATAALARRWRSNQAVVTRLVMSWTVASGVWPLAQARQAKPQLARSPIQSM